MLQTLAHVAISLLVLLAPLAIAWILLGRRARRNDTDRPAPPR